MSRAFSSVVPYRSCASPANLRSASAFVASSSVLVLLGVGVLSPLRLDSSELHPAPSNAEEARPTATNARRDELELFIVPRSPTLDIESQNHFHYAPFEMPGKGHLRQRRR